MFGDRPAINNFEYKFKMPALKHLNCVKHMDLNPEKNDKKIEGKRAN